MSLIFQCSSGILFFCGCCHFERNYTWPHKQLPISGSLINFCPCRFGSRIEEPSAESRRTSYIKVRLCLLLLFFYFILFCSSYKQSSFIFTHCFVFYSIFNFWLIEPSKKNKNQKNQKQQQQQNTVILWVIKVQTPPLLQFILFFVFFFSAFEYSSHN